MSNSSLPTSFFIGWDVGGWNCDKNRKSRDAIIILNSALAYVGQPWRGNLRECICGATTTHEWLAALFEHCEAVFPALTASVTMAIDTPLGFSEEFVSLVSNLRSVESVDTSKTNRYLYRHTERHLFAKGRRPLSAIKDMIGSQATKGMHALGKFAPVIESCGVWTDGAGFRVIETYPAACRNAAVVKNIANDLTKIESGDADDARTCAVVAYLFATDRPVLEEPGLSVPHREGWIWIPTLNA